MPVNSNWYAPKLNGVPFICLEASIPELGRKTAIFDYPNTDSRYVEDMGKVKGVYEITAQIQANNLTPSSYKRNKKKFEKAFAKMGIKTNIKMKTVGNVSINEKEDKKEDNGKEASAKQKAIKKGETLSGKQEPIKIDPEISDNK
jgi:hypothetical protein